MISELNDATILQTTDLFPLARGSSTLKISGSVLSNALTILPNKIVNFESSTPESYFYIKSEYSNSIILVECLTTESSLNITVDPSNTFSVGFEITIINIGSTGTVKILPNGQHIDETLGIIQYSVAASGFLPGNNILLNNKIGACRFIYIKFNKWVVLRYNFAEDTEATLPNIIDTIGDDTVIIPEIRDYTPRVPHDLVKITDSSTNFNLVLTPSNTIQTISLPNP